MSGSRFVVGIDLGTTNSGVAYVDTGAAEAADGRSSDLAVPQVVGPGAVADRPLLPSYLYLPGPGEVPAGSLKLPWDANRDYAAGEFARQQGSLVPTRLVSSAKSWLCHPGIDRKGPVLPWKGPEGGRRVSPLEASTLYLKHLVEAWNYQLARDLPDRRLEQQEVVLTVPASFDAAARELTVEAARAAGLENVTLLEEPQAAFYAWIEANGDAWRKLVKVGDAVLICDVGGGTTDLTLIAVGEESGRLELTRVAVGDHLLVGGDNMDLALAHSAARALAAQHQARRRPDAPAMAQQPGGQGEAVQRPVAGERRRDGAGPRQPGHRRHRPGRIDAGGSGKGVGGGLFPRLPAGRGAVAAEGGRLAGTGPALRRRPGRDQAPGAIPPSALRSVGGEAAGQGQAEGDFGADGGAVQRRRVQGGAVAAARGGGAEPLGEIVGRRRREGAAGRRPRPGGGAWGRLLRHGASRQGRAHPRRGGAGLLRRRGNVAAGRAGAPPPLKALCVAPFGMEEGTEADVPGQEFGLVVGAPAEFRFLGSSTRRGDAVGTMVEEWEGQIEELDPMATTLAAPSDEGRMVPVHLHSKITEIGTLELWCISRDGKQKWKLEFNVREKAE